MNASAENMKGKDLREIRQVFVFLAFEIKAISNDLLGAVPQDYLRYAKGINRDKTPIFIQAYFMREK